MKKPVEQAIIERMYLKTNTESYPEQNTPSNKKDQQRKKMFCTHDKVMCFRLHKTYP